MSYGRFKGGQHFNYLKKKGVTFEKATSKQKEILKSLNVAFEPNITKVRARYLINQARKRNESI
jgi:hypothetical protein